MYMHDFSLIRRNLESPVPVSQKWDEIYSSVFILETVIIFEGSIIFFMFID